MNDRQSLLDRIMFRLRDNRVAASAIAAGLVLASVATFTDSLTKVADAVRRLAPPVRVSGDWRSEPLREPGTDYPPFQYHFKLKAHGTQLFGTVYYIDPAGGPLKGAAGAVLNGKIEDNKISFVYLGGWNAKEIFYGVVSGDEIDFTYQRDRSIALHFVAKRVLLEGRSPAAVPRSENRHPRPERSTTAVHGSGGEFRSRSEAG